MAFLDWNPAYDTGVAGIDYEHRRLVKMLNEIHDLIENGVKPQKISDTLADFHTLATAHFALEEKIMQDENYPGLEGRRHTHYRLLDQVREIMDAYETGAYQPGESLPATLKEWLTEVIDIDAKLFAKINDAGLRRWGLSRT
ncbi:MAG: hemerythrin family protein [Rhizobiales bacterium]|nr:hemerythrin family protein [Hyphomicrobiales bacterium]